jgi:NADP-reducing hydrogenase subunit HndB
MAKLTLDDLRKLRETKKQEMNRRDTDGKEVQIMIGMGTCGIAAGAKEAFDAMLDQLDQCGVTNASIRQTGCMGLCYSEPTVEVAVPGMPTVVYGDVDVETARRIVKEHVVQHKMVSDHIYDKPAVDMVKS